MCIESKMAKKNIFLICPVRNASQAVREKIASYVNGLEALGHEVYWPDRDNPHQNTDKIGILIIDYNRRKMLEADEIHIWYDKNSTGSIFDLGMFFVISLLPYHPYMYTHQYRKFVIVNIEDIKPTPHKSFENVLLYWFTEQNRDPDFWNRIIE